MYSDDIFELGHLLASDSKVSGGKGASLARLAQHGFRVPECLIISDAALQKLDSKKTDKAIQDFLDRFPGEYFAVRSSAYDEDGGDHSFAGQHETFLNVRAEDVRKAITDCYGSFFKERALAYRKSKGIAAAKGGAVLIQRMIDADYAGVGFSIHPSTGQQQYMVIEYTEGLGDKLVSGEITPYQIVVHKNTLRAITDTKISPVLVKELSAHISQCEDIYKCPVDVEFAVKDNAIYFLQCRPITAFVNDDRPVFELLYTRHVSMIQNGAWDVAITKKSFEKEGWIYPNLQPCTFFIVKDGATQYWENEDKVLWFSDQIQQKNLIDPDFYDRAEKEYNLGIDKINRIIAQRGLDNIQEFKNFIDYLDDYIFYFGVLYYTAINPDVVDPLKSKAAVWREKDTMWVRLNEAIQLTIANIFPEATPLSLVLTNEDIQNGFDIKDVKNRLKGFIYARGFTSRTQTLDEAIDFLEQYRFVAPKPDPKSLLNNQLSGEPVYPGKIRGLANIIRSVNDLDGFTPGAVLVSPMTTPDLQTAMEKASAILTDEGGLLCHAAIVARELKIPCIVGLKVITSLVEKDTFINLDGVSGLVTIENK